MSQVNTTNVFYLKAKNRLQLAVTNDSGQNHLRLLSLPQSDPPLFFGQKTVLFVERVHFYHFLPKRVWGSGVAGGFLGVFGVRPLSIISKNDLF